MAEMDLDRMALELLIDVPECQGITITYREYDDKPPFRVVASLFGQGYGVTIREAVENMLNSKIAALEEVLSEYTEKKSFADDASEQLRILTARAAQTD